MNLDYFNSSVTNMDFQRTNLFSVAIGAGPGSKFVSTFENFINPLFGNTWVQDTGNALGFGLRDVASFIDNETNTAISNILNRTRTGSKFMAAMQSRIVTSFLGELNVGQTVLDYFEQANTVDMSIQDVKLPGTTVTHSYKWNQYSGRNHDIGTRSDQYLTLTFRRVLGPTTVQLRNGADNYIVWQEYMNLVDDQDGLRYFLDEITCTVQVNEHGRDGIPHSVHVFEDCIPIDIGEMSYSYESNNVIATFDVTLAFLNRTTGRVGERARIEWAEQFLAGAAKLAGQKLGTVLNPITNSLTTAAGQLNKQLLSTGNGMLGGSGPTSSRLL